MNTAATKKMHRRMARFITFPPHGAWWLAFRLLGTLDDVTIPVRFQVHAELRGRLRPAAFTSGWTVPVCYNRSPSTHVKRRRPLSAQLSQAVSRRRSWRGLLAFFRGRTKIPRRCRSGRRCQHRPRCSRNRPRNGRAILATGIRAYFTISFRAGGETCRPSSLVGSIKFSKRRASLFHFRWFRGNGNSY